MRSVGVLHSNRDNAEGLRSRDSVGQSRRALYWINEGGDKERYALFRVTSCPLGLLHGTAGVDLPDHCKKLFQLNGTNPHTSTFGTEADISHICQYGWYEWVYYRDVKTSFPYQKEWLGRCLGPAKNEGNAMAQWILRESGKVVPRRTLRRLTPDELSPSNEVESEKRSQFNVAIRSVLGDSVKIPKVLPLDNDATIAFDILMRMKMKPCLFSLMLT